MKIHKALKIKNRLAGELQRLQNILNRENARRSDSVSKVDREKVFNDLLETKSLLARLKGELALSTAPIVGKLAALEEQKNYIVFLNSLNTREGEEVSFVGRDQEKLIYTWDSFLNKEKIDNLVKETQDLINGLQDEIDEFNAKTDVNFS